MAEPTNKKLKIEDTAVAQGHQAILVIDFGSQYTQLITRRIRELGFFSVMIPGDSELERIKHINPKAIFLSGGPNSVHEDGSPSVPDGFFDYVDEHSIPLMGICYGMQLMVHKLGGRVEAAKGGGEYGRMPIKIESGSTLFTAESGPEQNVWMSHGDEAVELPENFKCIAHSKQGARVAIECAEKRMFGLQYHPEVVHSERGMETIRRFLVDIGGLKGDWSMQSVIDTEMEVIRKKVGPDAHVICALSGGVDSTEGPRVMLHLNSHAVLLGAMY